jgi:hypothetical protein
MFRKPRHILPPEGSARTVGEHWAPCIAVLGPNYLNPRNITFPIEFVQVFEHGHLIAMTFAYIICVTLPLPLLMDQRRFS